jgi:nucleosome binding factor SPN SPT16 subunit
LPTALTAPRRSALAARQSNKDTDWGGADAVVITAGKGEEEQTVYWVSVAAQLYLFDVELPESVLILTKDKLHFFGSSSKIKKLRVLEEQRPEKSIAPVLNFITKEKGDGVAAQLTQLTEILTAAGPKVGMVTKEEAFGDFAASWKEERGKAEGLQEVDVSAGLLEAMAAKDKVEMRNAKVAAVMTCAIMRKHLIPQLENIVDNETTITHSKVAEDLEELFDDPLKLASAWKAAAQIDRERVDMSYPPIIQSGGTYNLKPNAETSDEVLHYGTASSSGVILVSMGARYKSYCANLSRTILINPTDGQRKAYEVLTKLREKLLTLFVPGTRIGDVMVKAKEFLASEAPELLPKFVKNCGSGMGIVFRERCFLMTSKNDRKMREGMSFNLSIGFDGLEVEGDVSDEKAKTYALLLSDTIVVGETADVMTKPAGVEPKDVIWETRDGEDEDSGDDEDALLEQGRKALLSEVDMDKRKAEVDSAQDNRKQNQEQIAQKQRREAIARLKKMDEAAAKTAKTKTPVAYESVARYPKLKRPHQIFVDQSNDSVFLPVYGQPVPVHVAMIKNISRVADPNGRYVEMRINLETPGVTAGSARNKLFRDPKATFVKELIYRSGNSQRMSNAFQSINLTKKEWTRREKEKADKASLVKMESLKQYRGGPPPRLQDTIIRPSLGGRGRRAGTLEIHYNGVRYKSAQNAPLDITFANIKHSFFQAAVNEMGSEYRDDQVRIHFHLRNEVMVGKKKTKDVQFVAAVGEDNIKLSDVRRSAYDPDELEEEQRERDRRNKKNKEYKKFAMLIQENSEKTANAIEVDIPYKDLCFTGRASLKGASRGESFFMPTKDCLVDLSEPPFFLLDTNELEIAYFERVSHNLKYFDMVFVCKDYETWVRIDAIPTKKLENVKTWIDSINVRKQHTQCMHYRTVCPGHILTQHSQALRPIRHPLPLPPPPLPSAPG